MTELKACPFCGGEASLSQGQMGPTRAQADYVECLDCAASGEMFFSKDMAMRVWNARTPDFDTVAEILAAGKLEQMTIAMFKPKYTRLLDFVRELTFDFPDRDNYREVMQDEAKELLKEIGEYVD